MAWTKSIKKILFITIDVIFHILFWAGLPFTLCILPELTSFERVVEILTGQIETMEHGRGSSKPNLSRMMKLVPNIAEKLSGFSRYD
jgi:hypothetical protein